MININNMKKTDSKSFNALVLAASRKGPNDAVAQIQKKTHKCLVTINKITMIERVIQQLVNTKYIKTIFVSIESSNTLNEVPRVVSWIKENKVILLKSEKNLAESIFSAVKNINDPYPLIITAGDNALHTTEMLEYFCESVINGDSDAYIAMTLAKLILDKYPKGARAFHSLKDDDYSSCNLYAITNEKGINGAKPFATGGQFGKKPIRIAQGFGLLSLILYKLQLLTLEGVTRRISKAIKAKTTAVIMPWAEGPIDVDSPNDFDLVSEILRKREQN